MSEVFDAVVVGAGPGGEVAVSRLAAGGLRTALVEKELIGGECGYYGCIPSKTLLRGPEAQAQAERVAGLSRPALDWPALRDYRDVMVRHHDDSRQVEEYRKNGVEVVKGSARFVGRDPWTLAVGDRVLAAEHVVLATGSQPVRPDVPGLDRVPVWTNREATSLREIPGRAALIGGGPVAVELGHFLARMGCEVTLLVRGERLLAREDPRLGEEAARLLAADGATVLTGRQVRSARPSGSGGAGGSGDAGGSGGAVLELDDGRELTVDVVVLGTGRRPGTAGLGLEEVGVPVDVRGALPVDDRCRAAPGLWAVGDVTGRPAFTHLAKYHARVAADTILGKRRVRNDAVHPRVVFTEPEIAAVGMTPAEAERAGIDTAEATVDLAAALARPWTFDTEPRGRLGLLADRERRVLVGAWAVAPMAGEFIHYAVLAIRAAVPIDVLLDDIAQFPTYSEGFLNALEQLEL